MAIYESLIWLLKHITLFAHTAVTIFAIYFGYNKIGKSIAASFSVGGEVLSETRICEIFLLNRKDRKILIREIFAVINKEFYLPLENYKNIPVLLDAHAGLNIKISPISCYILNGKKYKPDFFLYPNKITIYVVECTGKEIKCKEIYKPMLSYKSYIGKSIHWIQGIKLKVFKQQIFSTFKEKVFIFFTWLVSLIKEQLFRPKSNRHNLKLIEVLRISFDDVVYNDQAKYALIYSINNLSRVSFIMKSGFITNWPFKTNYISHLESIPKENILQLLQKLPVKNLNILDRKEFAGEASPILHDN